MNKLSIKARLWMLVCGLMAIMAIATALLFQRLYTTNQAIDSIYANQVVPLKQMADIISGYIDGVLVPIDQAANGKMTAADATKTMEEGLAKANKHWQDFMGTTFFGEEKDLVAKTEPLVRQAAPLIPQAISLMRSGQVENALSFKEKTLQPVMDPLLQGLEAISIVQLANAKNTADESREAMQTLMIFMAFAVLVVFGLCVAASHVLIKKITDNLNHAVDLAERVAKGDLTAQIHSTSQDETGRLLNALATMNRNLVQIVQQIRDSSESIVTGASQIATGNDDLSQRTEEQASNLQRTAASMEELTATVRQNSDNANQATHLASQASATAAEGGEAMQRVNNTMENISTSSSKISDIIGVIDSIAFQTNILALNAAVEAARAGEQGRGFAVVASEVRNLAKRSSDAAREIHALIHESTQRVSAGAEHVQQAGTTMHDIVRSVERVSQLIAQIAVASEEQATGLASVTQSATQMEGMTQQNAAMVEEVAAAAAHLENEAARLHALMGAFRLKHAPQQVLSAPAHTAPVALPAPPQTAALLP